MIRIFTDSVTMQGPYGSRNELIWIFSNKKELRIFSRSLQHAFQSFFLSISKKQHSALIRGIVFHHKEHEERKRVYPLVFFVFFVVKIAAWPLN